MYGIIAASYLRRDNKIIIVVDPRIGEVTNLVVTNTSQPNFKLTFTPIPHATSYDVYVDDEFHSTITGSNAVLGGFTDVDTYTFKMITRSGTLSSGYSNVVDTHNWDIDVWNWMQFCSVTKGYSMPYRSKLLELNAAIIKFKDWGVWQKLDVMYFYGWAEQRAEQCSLVDIKRIIESTPHGSLTYKEEGFKGNGTNAYIDLKFNPSTQGSNYQRNNASRWVTVFEAPTDSDSILLGTLNTSGVQTMYNKNTNLHTFNSNTNTLNGTVNFSGTGTRVQNRLSSTSVISFDKTTQTSRTSTSSNSNYSNNYLLFRSGNKYSNAWASTVFFGSNLTATDILRMRTAMNTAFAKFGLSQHA